MGDDQPRRVGYAVASSRFVGKALRGAWAAHSGLWLGMMDGADLDRTTEEFYASEGRWADGTHNAGGLALWEETAIVTHFPANGHVLVPAAGAGREVLALTALGYRVTGIDPSPELVEAGEALVAATFSESSLITGPPDHLPEGVAGPFDAVLFGWGGISHLRGRDTRIGLLTEIRGLMAPGRPLIVSFLSREPGSQQFAMAYRVGAAVRKLRRSAEPLEVGDVVDGSFDHYFTFDEMAAELAEAGFAERERIPEPYAHIVCEAS